MDFIEIKAKNIMGTNFIFCSELGYTSTRGLKENFILIYIDIGAVNVITYHANWT